METYTLKLINTYISMARNAAECGDKDVAKLYLSHAKGLVNSEHKTINNVLRMDHRELIECTITMKRAA